MRAEGTIRLKPDATRNTRDLVRLRPDATRNTRDLVRLKPDTVEDKGVARTQILIRVASGLSRFQILIRVASGLSRFQILIRVASGFSRIRSMPVVSVFSRTAEFAWLLCTLTILSIIPTVATAAQRDGQTPAAPTNLQVLSKNMSPQDVVATMQRFTQALGVPCTYCHVQAAPELLTPEQAAAAQAQGRGRGRGQGPPPMDFAADDKPQKHIARAMISLTNDINSRLSLRAGSAAPDGVRVQCVTCHRGVTIPRQLADILSETMLTKGDGAAVALYRDLRQKYYGGQAYDFRESVLLSLARQALAANKPDDALAFLRLNLEFYPESVGSYLALADAHTRKRDRAAARQDLEKALEFDPENTTVQRRLNALKVVR